MMQWLIDLNTRWMRVGQVIGHYVSGTVLTIFYFTIFALFAIPYRVAGFLSSSGVAKKTAYKVHEGSISFENEF